MGKEQQDIPQKACEGRDVIHHSKETKMQSSANLRLSHYYRTHSSAFPY